MSNPVITSTIAGIRNSSGLGVKVAIMVGVGDIVATGGVGDIVGVGMSSFVFGLAGANAARAPKITEISALRKKTIHSRSGRGFGLLPRLVKKYAMLTAKTFPIAADKMPASAAIIVRIALSSAEMLDITIHP